MKKLLYFVLLLAALSFACSLPSTATPEVTEPPLTELPVTEMPVVTNTTCNELSLYLDPALASGYDCQSVPASPSEFDVYPAHTELALQGYPLAGKFFEPHISIYPVAAYAGLRPDVIPGFVSSLQGLTGGGPAPVFTGDFDSPHLPFLPLFNAGEVFFAQYQVVPFVSGGGIRFLTEFAQYAAPVNNTDLFYTYQGLTPDGNYWVSAILPVNLAVLPADATNPPGGVSWEDFTNNYTGYIVDMVAQLNSQPAEAFTPSLSALDALVASITVTP